MTETADSYQILSVSLTTINDAEIESLAPVSKEEKQILVNQEMTAFHEMRAAAYTSAA